MGSPKEADDRDFVRALARGLTVIEAFKEADVSLTLSEIAKRVELSRGSTRRLLLTLTRLGYVGANESGRFQLLPSVLRLGYSYLSSQPVWALSRSVLERLSDETNEACSITVLDKHDVVYVARVAPRQIMNDQVSIGSRLPAYCTSLGRVLLTGLDQTEFNDYLGSVSMIKYTPKTETSVSNLQTMIETARRDGYAVVDQEIEVGLRSIAVPIRDGRGVLVAAINVSTKDARIDPDEQVRIHLPVLQRSATEISTLIKVRQMV